MGMSIDESRQSLSYYQKLFNSLNGDYRLSQVQVSELSHSIGTVLDTMRKYQKIAELYDYWRSGKCEYTISCMKNIGKVLRDENDD